jgi:hypothetical protein
MRCFTRRFAVACGCALAAAAFSGAAVAGDGHGKESAPGQQKQEQAAATQPVPAQQGPEQQTGAQDQAQQAEHSPPGQERKQEKAAAPTSAVAGVKPSNTTTHWTHCTTGGAGTGSASCTAQAGTAQAKTQDVSADVSKRYGNGETAAQIAVGRGAPDGTLVTGPGNSQPHKVSACGKKSNRSGGVDVHAVKSYDASACRPAGSQSVLPVQPVPVQPVPVQQTQAASVNATATSTASTSAPTSTASATQGSSPATQSAGGVLGTSKTIAKPKPVGGVLGTVLNNTVSNVAGQTLPFTGFPIWVAMLVALGLIAAGLVLRRRVAVAPA